MGISVQNSCNGVVTVVKYDPLDGANNNGVSKGLGAVDSTRLQFKEGLLDLVKQVRGYETDQQLSDALEISRETLRKVRNRTCEPSTRLIRNVAVLTKARRIDDVIVMVRL